MACAPLSGGFVGGIVAKTAVTQCTTYHVLCCVTQPYGLVFPYAGNGQGPNMQKRKKRGANTSSLRSRIEREKASEPKKRWTRAGTMKVRNAREAAHRLSEGDHVAQQKEREQKERLRFSLLHREAIVTGGD